MFTPSTPFPDDLFSCAPIDAHALDLRAPSPNFELSLIRLDQTHDTISGNKWFKLMPRLKQAHAQGWGLLSFGGPYSNHIHALAYAGYRLGLKTTGVVRGYPHYLSNPTLTDAQKWGMSIELVDKQTYSLRNDPSYLLSLSHRYPGHLIVPEGGTDRWGVAGAAKIWDLPVMKNLKPDYVVVPVGSGGTFAGLISAAPDGVKVIGIPVLKGTLGLETHIHQLLAEQGIDKSNEWYLDSEGHFGGYGKTTPDLMAFIECFETEQKITLDPVYTGKMMLRLHTLVAEGYFPSGARIAVIHTGGLQGKRGFKK